MTTRKWILKCSMCGYLDYYSEHQLTPEKIKDFESRVGNITSCPNCKAEEMEVKEVRE